MSEPEVAVMVICDVAGVGALGVGDVGAGVGALLIPLLHPAIAPVMTMQRTARSEVRSKVDRRRRPARPRSPNGSRVAKAAALWVSSVAV